MASGSFLWAKQLLLASAGSGVVGVDGLVRLLRHKLRDVFLWGLGRRHVFFDEAPGGLELVLHMRAGPEVLGACQAQVVVKYSPRGSN